ncbi:hypothetical protein FA95DRAFT_1612155 [Auriscalpium vulgare]|uniref:Uncharacterized protein n=1 Tax=Auriscalpium vulgare TaxID=40419 RepID=A0ACB8R7G2_9AGAM|nr:hypothetical protein FA95DRAFT_1612155 [Auriscalpium vulgare]
MYSRILLALAVLMSATLMGRSIILLRRRRAALLEAIADGPYGSSSPLVSLADLPKMTEVYVDTEDEPRRDVQMGWADLMPVSARVVENAGSEDAAPPQLQAHEFLRPRLSPPFHRPRATPAPPAPRRPPLPPRASSESARPSPPPPVPVQVAVLVAMPRRGSGAARDVLPVLEIGVGVAHRRVDEIASEQER